MAVPGPSAESLFSLRNVLCFLSTETYCLIKYSLHLFETCLSENINIYLFIFIFFVKFHHHVLFVDEKQCVQIWLVGNLETF